MRWIGKIIPLAIAIFILANQLTLVATAEPLKTQVMQTPGGLSFLHLPTKKIKRTAVFISWPTNLSQLPVGREGTALLAAQLMTKAGAGRLKARQMVEKLRDLDIKVQLIAKARSVRLYFDAANETQFEAASYISQILAEPSFDRKWFERIRGKIFHVFSKRERTNIRMAQLAANYFLMGNNRYTRFISLHPSNVISAVQREDVIAWHKRIFSRRGATIVSAGSADIKSIGLTIDRILAGLPDKVAPIAKSKMISRINRRSKTIVLQIPEARKSTVFTIGKVLGGTASEGHKRGFSINILSKGPNSRLFNRLRTELGLVYNVKSRYFSLTTNDRHVAVSIDLEPKALKMGLAAIRKTYREFQSIGVRNSEFRGIRIRQLREISMLMEQPGFLADQLLSARVNGFSPDNFLGLPSLVANLTDSELNHFIRHKFPPVEQLTTIIVTSNPIAFAGACIITNPIDASDC